jgi:hypothetical protein
MAPYNLLPVIDAEPGRKFITGNMALDWTSRVKQVHSRARASVTPSDNTRRQAAEISRGRITHGMQHAMPVCNSIHVMEQPARSIGAFSFGSLVRSTYGGSKQRKSHFLQSVSVSPCSIAVSTARVSSVVVAEKSDERQLVRFTPHVREISLSTAALDARFGCTIWRGSSIAIQQGNRNWSTSYTEARTTSSVVSPRVLDK